jgi:hypothetical protein
VKPILHADCCRRHLDSELSSGARRPGRDRQGDGPRPDHHPHLEQAEVRLWQAAARPDRADDHRQARQSRRRRVSAISTRLDAPAGKEHSEKPAQSYIDFERVVAAPRYFELFARRPMPPNWDGHGNQVGSWSTPARPPKAEIDPSKPLKVKTLLEALEAIEAGRAIVVTGKKITEQVNSCISGSIKKPKLDADRQGEAGGAAPRARGR